MDTTRAVQLVTKASSDKLLLKFAEIDSDTESPSLARKSFSKRHGRKKRKVKRSSINNNVISGDENNLEMSSCIMMSPLKEQSLRVVERNSLLPQHYRTRRSSSSGSFLLKHLGISKSHHFRGGARDFRTKCVLSALEKTWSKAVRGASKVFMEKHYNRHRSLIDDIV